MILRSLTIVGLAFAALAAGVYAGLAWWVGTWLGMLVQAIAQVF
jgi:hypothetical protein